MPNPGGGNQFGNFTLQPKYGDVAKQTQLLKEAPISGAPFAAQALNAPRRQGKAAARGKQQPSPLEMPPPQAEHPPISPGTPPVVFQQIAAIPGASPLVQSLFANA